MQNAVELHIDELVLHGFAPADRYRIAEALERELTRLLGAGELAGAGTDVSSERLDGGSFAVAPGMRPAQIGAEAAQAVYRSVLAQNSAAAQPPSPARATLGPGRAR